MIYIAEMLEKEKDASDSLFVGVHFGYAQRMYVFMIWMFGLMVDIRTLYKV
ncbi:hypothetical protein WAK64_11275 [Bacillus spongiae]|uniref:Uncharacterized protein n=1 Tax=Bacillus spongiae TaxID=2683610 RepID=A0ABU8HEB2_9BACI